MQPETKSHLESRIRLLLAGAQRQCDEAHEHEDQARYLRGAAERDRIVASEIQALIDSTTALRQPQDETSGVPTREVQHVDTDEPEAEGLPPHVWLYRNMLTDLQAVAPLGKDDTNGQYAVAIDELTDEQRAIPHVAKQLPGDVLTVAVEAGSGIEENDIVRRC